MVFKNFLRGYYENNRDRPSIGGFNLCCLPTMQAQPGGVRPGGRGGPSLTIDRDWTLITFALKSEEIIFGPCSGLFKTLGINAAN